MLPEEDILADFEEADMLPAELDEGDVFLLWPDLLEECAIILCEGGILGKQLGPHASLHRRLDGCAARDVPALGREGLEEGHDTAL